MQMEMEQRISELLELAGKMGIVPVLYGVLGGQVQVNLSFTAKTCATELDELEFSVRACTALKRAGIFTVGQTVDLIAAGGLLRIRNLGKKTQNEIKTRILAFGYERLSEKEKRQFLRAVLWKNGVG
jgi:DNA-directed RNA polymerase alpha subunit